jgi:hypothetical protein
MKNKKYGSGEINELLIDYMENDLSEGLRSDLNLVVRNSPSRDKTLRAFAETKKLVKAAEPAMPGLGEEFFDKLHGRIMSEVSVTKPSSARVLRARLWLGERSWRSYAALAATAAAVLLVSGATLFSFLKPNVQFQSAGTDRGDMLLSISVEVPEAFADSLLNDRASSDFYLDAVAQKVAQLEEKNASNLIDRLGK